MAATLACHRPTQRRRTQRMKHFVADCLGTGEHFLQLYWPGPPTKVTIIDSGWDFGSREVEIAIDDPDIDLETVVEFVEDKTKAIAKLDMQPPSLDDIQALTSSVKQFGVIYPAVFDAWGWLLDGGLRLQIASELGVPCPTMTVGKLDSSDRRRLANDLDLCRKATTREEKRLAVKSLLLRTPATSNRQIGRMVGVDHKTVAKYRHELEAAGDIPHLEAREGEDGKTYRLPKIVASNQREHDRASRGKQLLANQATGSRLTSNSMTVVFRSWKKSLASDPARSI